MSPSKGIGGTVQEMKAVTDADVLSPRVYSEHSLHPGSHRGLRGAPVN